MSRTLEVSRREFLMVSAAAGGGLMLGWRMNAAETTGGPSVLNAWITIHRDGVVTFVCPRNEMGQDVQTSLVMLLAEELAIDPRRVTVAEAPPDPVYVNKLLGVQMTGGSTSVRDAWVPLRQAGAVARTMLVGAAAARWRVPSTECRAQDGAVTHGEKALGYGELASAAARQPVPKEVTLKAAGDFAVIGKPLPRLDGADKARGRTVYGIDVKQPGMMYAAIAACPVLGGRVASFDGAAALKRPGVRKVVDIGEAIAVIADRYWVAHSALADVKIQWDEGKAAALDTAAIYAALEQAEDEPGTVIKQAGDVDAVFAKVKPIEARYTSQMLAHMTLEPQNCLARVSPSGVDVWVGTQIPERAQAIAAQAAGVEARAGPHPPPVHRRRFRPPAGRRFHRPDGGDRQAGARNRREVDLEPRGGRHARLLPAAEPASPARGARRRSRRGVRTQDDLALDHVADLSRRREERDRRLHDRRNHRLQLRHCPSRPADRDPRRRHPRGLLAVCEQRIERVRDRELHRRARALGGDSTPSTSASRCSRTTRGSTRCSSARPRKRASRQGRSRPGIRRGIDAVLRHACRAGRPKSWARPTR